MSNPFCRVKDFLRQASNLALRKSDGAASDDADGPIRLPYLFPDSIKSGEDHAAALGISHYTLSVQQGGEITRVIPNKPAALPKDVQGRIF